MVGSSSSLHTKTKGLGQMCIFNFKQEQCLSNDIKSKHIFIDVIITFANNKMFIFQPFILKNKTVLDPHDFKTVFVSALELHYSNYKDKNDNNNNCSIFTHK